MGDLPSTRCNIARPFLNTGLDYAGPLYVKTSKRRNAPFEKAYIALFVCMAVKAVHLELVSNMTSEAFIAALKRFVARRGIPKEICCDNGTNFVGANNELKRLKNEIISQQQNSLTSSYILQNCIKFRFNPPSAPHFGGLWEASMKSAKYHLRRVTNTSKLTYEETTTMITQIEAIMNSRPICRLDDNIESLKVLTPGHFIIGEPLVAIPEHNLEFVPVHKLDRWQNMQWRVQSFWKCWSRDYLNTLQQRYRWKNQVTVELILGDIVMVMNETAAPQYWPMGRVVQVHRGADNITRVVTVKTTYGELKRPVTKLIRLPVDGRRTENN